jgi:hypothetical protein
MYAVPPAPEVSADDSTDPKPVKPGPKVTQRMLQLRELIAHGEYPDKDELAERIVDKI